MNSIRLESKAYNALYFLIFFLPLFIPTPGFPTKISAEGVEQLQGRPVATVRNIALSNALKITIEKAAKEMSPNLDDKSLEKLRSEDPTRYIKAYRILDGHSLGEEYKISIEANVDSEKLRNRLEGFAVTSSKTSGKPSISIVVLQNPESDPIIKSLSLSDIKREISVALIGSGYRIAEPLGDVRLETYVTLRTTESKIGQVMYYALGSVLIRAKDKDGKVIIEVSDSIYSDGVNLSQLSLEVLKEAGAKVAKKLKSEFDKRWNVTAEEVSISRAETVGAFELTFNGVRNYNQYEQLDNILSTAREIDRITKRIFKGREVSFFVLSRMNPEKLVKIIEKSDLQGFSLKFDNATLGRIEFSVIK